jgi:hypothetical protein
VGIHVRGSAVHNTVKSIRERFGPEAHERVLRVLPAAHCGAFLAGVRDAAWVPIEDLVAYLETARRVLAPGDDGLFRALGRDAGLSVRHSGVRLFLGSNPGTAATRSAFFWRFYYDGGRVECEPVGSHTLRLHFLDFRTPSRAWCERIAGFMESCFELMEHAGRVEETACIHRGAPHCELTMEWVAKT